jgi:anaerobic magnesium-protoporphyrin IX monomethyl ester cyclase
MSKRRLDMYWWCFSRADTIVRNEYMVKKMADAGARTVFLGIESANHEILDEYNKKTTLRQLHQAFEILRDHKIKTWGSFVIGGLNETKKMIKNTVQLAKRLNPDTVQFSILTPYPGTKLFESVKSRIAFRNWDLYDGAHAIMPTKHLTPAELQKSIVKAYSRFYLRFSKLPGVFAYIKSRNLRVGNIFKTLLHIWQIKRSYMAENKYRKPERESWI